MTEVAAAAPLRIDVAVACELLATNPGLLGEQVGVDVPRGPVIRQHVAIELGAPEQVPNGTRWTLMWTPVGLMTTLPAFEGVLEICEDDHERAVLRVRGSYLPPLGIVGMIVDRVIGHRVAEASVEQFVAAAARRLDRAEVQRSSRSWRGPEQPADLRPV